MTEEDEEFHRLEREAKMRALEDDDTQDYKKPWVELSDFQIENIYNEVVKVYRGAAMPYGQLVFGRAVQAKLRELNT